METVIRINDTVNSFAWGTFGLSLLLGTGLLCTIISGFFQITHLKHWFSNTFGILNGRGRIINDAGALSQRRAFWTSLCATIGTGNIAGVSTAICLGGPGAVFWMWVAAFLGMMVKYSENLLGMYYRRRNSEGSWSGGPMYYLEDGLGSIKNCKRLGKILGILFCIFTVLASFGIGNMAQINKITINVGATFFNSDGPVRGAGVANVNLAIGIVLMIATAGILLGGFRRLSAVSELLVPYMSVIYIAGCLVLILFHITGLPAVFASIFRFALGPAAIKGGAAGTAMQIAFNTIKNGCKRGVFSNEAGLGSSVMVHSTSCSREPVHQGLWGIAEVFLDTIIICTITAIVILNSEAVDLSTGLVKEGVNDATLVAQEFGNHFGKPGEFFVVIAITLFAFTTVLGWSFYGSKVTEYLLGVTASKIYRVIFVGLIIFGAIMESNLAWDISDTFNGLMMIPNLIGLVVQIPLIIELTRNYTDRRIKGKDIEAILSYDVDIQKDAQRAVLKGAD
ncbi:alanine/glycine:cation symporter family protein [Butyrivibrio sp. VCD2006]|uniref:alanine/glycine:cation symporter family protein n=1 Tax=Butyrivibrio sp. VCD2006 TaxID=1280664 RepID=UPI0003F655E2|nr:alanine/glycine:cation symporter family protein [Butyrivibrio sp. VCD2006]